MRVPTLDRAEGFLREAEALNPGPWVEHSRHVAAGARTIAERHPALDPEAAYVVGLLHDIGRRAGVTGARHVLDGYRFLAQQGYVDAARICLSHSFPTRRVGEIFGPCDCTDEELQFIGRYLAEVEYDDYDRLIQLCDALTMASGFVLMEKRLMDVALRYGINEHTVPKWQAFFAIQAQFEKVIGCSIYTLLPGVVENTFGMGIKER